MTFIINTKREATPDPSLPAERDREERKLTKVRVSIMRTKEFLRWSGLLMMGDVYVDDNVPTACTNGRDERYGRQLIRMFFNKEKMLAFIVLHENLHKGLRHMTIWRNLTKIDARLANMAMDYVINLWLVEMDPGNQFIEFPTIDGQPFGLLDYRFKGMDTKQVFDILRKEQEEGGGDDRHRRGKGGKPGDPGTNPGGGSPGDPNGEFGGFDTHDWDGAEKLSEAEQKKLEQEIDRVLRQGEQLAKRAGVGSGNRLVEMEELMQPQVDWKEVLREFIVTLCAGKDNSSWRKLNRRHIANDVYLPSLVGERVGKIVIGGDLSGSVFCTPTLIQTFLSEVVHVTNMVSPEQIDLLWWDTKVTGHEVYDVSNMSSLAETTKPVGGGGTDPTCVLDYIKEKKLEPVCIIMLTDGEIGNWGTDWPAPVLWIIANSPHHNIIAPVGTSISISEG